MKYIVKKVIKGNPYYYLQYKNYSRILGPFLPDNIKNQLQSFFQEIAEKKSKKIDPQIIGKFSYKSPKTLEEKHYWYICFSQNEIFQKNYNDFLSWFTILFTFNSNRAEGSKVTRPEIEKFAFSRIRKPKTRTEREIYNSFQAIQYAFSKEMKWDLKSIKKLHFILLQGLDDSLILGKWKNENNTAPGNQPTIDFKKVSNEMENLIKWLSSEIKKKTYPPLIAINFYLRFERIHPFLDGNGRVGRILLNSILQKYKYMPVIFYNENHKSHCEAIRQALEGRSKKFNTHFIDQTKKTYQQLIKLINQ